MPRSWPYRKAQRRFDDVVEAALRCEPQIVIRDGVATVVVIACDEFRRLTRRRETISEFFRRSPLVGMELDLARTVAPTGI